MYAVGTNFSGRDLSNADFVDAILVDANFSGADLSGADLGRANLRGANFVGADLSGANFVGAVYDSETSFWDTDGTIDSDEDGVLDFFDLPEEMEGDLIFLGPMADLRGVNLDMMAISWTPEIDEWADEDGDGYGDYSVSFTSSRPLDLKGANLSGASLGSPLIFLADFSGADMSGVDFHGTDLAASNFTDTDLRGADLSGVSIHWSDLSGADLSGADLSGMEAWWLMGCPSALPAGWVCMPTGEVDPPHCPDGETSPDWVETMGELLDVLDMSDCTFNLLGPSMGGRLVAYGVDLSGLDLGLRPMMMSVETRNLTGCPIQLHESYLCTGGVILGPGVWASHANLSGMDLSGMNLSGSLLFNTDLSGADLSGANLSWVYFDGVNLSGADLDGADVSEVNWVASGYWRDQGWYDRTVICPDGTNSSNNDDGCANNI